MNADRSVLVGVQELLPRRRRQRFALVVLARNGLSSATECLSGTPFLWACERSTARSGQTRRQ